MLLLNNFLDFDISLNYVFIDSQNKKGVLSIKNDLMLLFTQKNPDLLVEYIDNLNHEKFSLVSLIDSLSPMLVMESNLRFGNFHLIKMNLFIRNLSLRSIFSRETEIALAKVIVLHLYYLEWVQISASPYSHVPESIDAPIVKMLTEIREGNTHNAFFYANIALKSEKDNLLDALLYNGAISIPDTLGHSLTCFFPVLDELIDMDHPSTGTALLSYIMYLCRFRKKSEYNKNPADITLNFEMSELLQRASSGTSIIDIHHMITYYIFIMWERAVWHKGNSLPWFLLVDWIGEKKVDTNRLENVLSIAPTVLPREYEHWRFILSEKNKQRIISVVISLLDKSWQQACDWLFRSYAEYYTPDWDPHYFTGLYAALEMYRDDTIDKVGSKMALIQALEYFIDNI